MAQGLEIYDEGGSPTISVTTSLCRVLGKVDLTDSQGTIVCEDSRRAFTAYLTATHIQSKSQSTATRLTGYI